MVVQSSYYVYCSYTHSHVTVGIFVYSGHSPLAQQYSCVITQYHGNHLEMVNIGCFLSVYFSGRYSTFLLCCVICSHQEVNWVHFEVI